MTMGVNGYVGRILFVILVAVAFSYRQQIMETVNRTLGRTSGSSSSSSSSKDKTPSQEQPRTIPIRPPNPDYYNPPFDPSSPPEPLFSKSGVRMITANELQAHGHSGELTPIWLAVMGKVFDVQKGAEHYYGPNGGYKFFTGELFYALPITVSVTEDWSVLACGLCGCCVNVFCSRY